MAQGKTQKFIVHPTAAAQMREAGIWNDETWTESTRIETPADGVPCEHKGCERHISHPCECCGRIGANKNA